jgi:AraC family transcriptional regulator, regulatory protein of adaptative response / DNA-3-methyladenine glycosylase II
MLDHETCYRAVSSRDPRFDGWFVTAVRTTGIYCRPSCPATTPKRRNVVFHPTAAAAQLAGFRACRRCRPDASPGSPEWNVRSDTVGRAMRLIGDGAVDRDGVAGLAQRLGYSERQLHRLLVAEVGAGAQALARAQRAHTARVLVETTDLRLSEVAFAAGFASIRQFNDTVRAVFATTPRDLREKAASRGAAAVPGTMVLRLATRRPFEGRWLLDLLALKAVPGVESYDGTTFRRALLLPHGEATVDLTPADDHVLATLRLEDPRDVVPAVARCRRLLDLDADSAAVDETLVADPLLAPLVAGRPGIRVPGSVDGAEMAAKAVIGQQVSVAGARTVAGRLVTAYGKPLTRPDGGLTHHFPTADVLASVDPETLPMPRARARTLVGLAAAVAAGEVDLDPGADRDTVEATLLAMPGIGPWTADYLRMRVLGDPDSFLASDLGVRRGLERLGAAGDPRSAAARAEAWRPWRSYALMHLWDVALQPARPTTDRKDRS